MLLKGLKKLVIKRANGLCEYCKSPANISTESFCVEHIIPKCKGGKTESENLALSCYGCNSHKYSKTEGIDPAMKTVVILYHPRNQKWFEHFAWKEDSTEIIGLTPSGRATVETLKLNRKELINLRKLLIQVGEHPPEEKETS